jgi:hypothetical protein
MIIPELEGKIINLDMNPQQAIITHQIALKADHEQMKKWIVSFKNMAFPFVDVWKFQARLAFMVFSENGKMSWIHRLTEDQRYELGISNEMLINAIQESGATLEMDGYYPVNAAIRSKLAEML